MSKTKKVAKKVTKTARKSAAAAKGAAKKVAKSATRTASKARSTAKSGTKKAAVNAASGPKVVKKTSKKTTKKTTRSAKPASTVKRGSTPKKAATGRAKKSGSTSTTKSAPKRATKAASKGAAKVAKGAGKSTRRSGARKGRGSASERIDVKTGSLAPKPGSFGFAGSGGGLSLLSGKPGSSGSTEPGTEAKRLTRTKLNVRELRHFRELLLQKRRQLLGDMDSMESEALRTEGTNLSHLPVHMADMGTDNYEQEFTLNLVDRDRKLIDEIDHALAKINKKTFGICEGTGQMISKARLEAQPWARFSIEHARRLQQPGMRR